MKWITRTIERFCINHRRFGVPNLMMYIIAGKVLVWLVYLMDTSGSLLSLLTYNPYLVLRGQVWRLVTFALIPDTLSPLWFALQMLFYYYIGNSLEQEWGSARFTLYYLTGMLATILFGFICLPFGFVIQASSYYLNLAMFFSYALLFPETWVRIYFLIPVKIKWLGWLQAVFFVWEVFFGFRLPGSLLPVVGVINVLFFCWDEISGPLRGLRGNMRSRSSGFAREGSGFRQETRREARGDSAAPYQRKCSVCGKTDVDHPDLDFRYCSRCEGYHCFCADHIYNHRHYDK